MSYFILPETRKHDRDFADDIFVCFFVNENVGISMKILLKMFPGLEGQIDNIGSEHGLSPNRRKNILWLSDNWVYVRLSASII